MQPALAMLFPVVIHAPVHIPRCKLDSFIKKLPIYYSLFPPTTWPISKIVLFKFKNSNVFISWSTLLQYGYNWGLRQAKYLYLVGTNHSSLICYIFQAQEIVIVSLVEVCCYNTDIIRVCFRQNMCASVVPIIVVWFAYIVHLMLGATSQRQN